MPNKKGINYIIAITIKGKTGMKNIKIFILSITLLITFISCKNEKSNNVNLNNKLENNSLENDSSTTKTEMYVSDENGKKMNVDSLININNNKNFDKEKWRTDAQEYLKQKYGKEYKVKPNDYNKTNPKTNSNNYNNISQTHNDDFEYSEYWRKEAFKVAKQHLNYKISKKNCIVISQGFFQPNLVKYIGNRGYSVKIKYSYDCHQNYVNEVYFLVEVYYLSVNNWDVEIVNQRFDD